MHWRWKPCSIHSKHTTFSWNGRPQLERYSISTQHTIVFFLLSFLFRHSLMLHALDQKMKIFNLYLWMQRKVQSHWHLLNSCGHLIPLSTSGSNPIRAACLSFSRLLYLLLCLSAFPVHLQRNAFCMFEHIPIYMIYFTISLGHFAMQQVDTDNLESTSTACNDSMCCRQTEHMHPFLASTLHNSSIYFDVVYAFYSRSL